ncbi:hypothetical protein VM1G_11005 [Cytospora mali]|uniref:Rhodopsin domain-containing protein n=1 Tax=Cytospora mali TaxID=578113 RepID=A0A194VJA5_CYTMA|nr:hypothetical protein VM1G_11005 [Valsa mali]
MVEPKGDGLTLLYVTAVMGILSWITVLSRLAVRRWLKPEAMGLDDYLMCIGLILYSVTSALVIVCCFYGAGQKHKFLSDADVMQGTKLFFIAEFFYAACTAPIKGSICVCLLRIADSRRRFVWSLWAIIGATAIAPIIFIFVVANICHPITALWGETAGTCNSGLNSSVSYFFSAVSILTDWAMAILPGVLLWNVQLKRRVKGSVTVILGLAAFASCATIVRLSYLTLYNNQAEFMFSTGKIGLWSVVEEGIGITAGSMPALRPVLSLSFFNRFSRSGSGGSGAGTLRSSANGLQGRSQHTGDAVGMNTLRSHRNTRSKSEVSGDSESQKYILKETQVSITAEAYGGTEEWKKQRSIGWTNNGSDWKD